MIRFFLLFAFILLFCGFSYAQKNKVLYKGIKITQSVSFKNRIYKIDADSNINKPAIIIEGENITIDFNNANLQGSNSAIKPDEYYGTAILIRNSKNVTIKNFTVKGYTIALFAKNTEGLVIDNCDFSYNYRQHLNSTPEREDISDWMSFHHNENNEWLRYGAAMYLQNCNAAIVKNCKVTGGQNALMMAECNSARIFNNDFSFNSGIGIGLYRSCDNQIFFNRLIFNVRGYSYGVYSRGQDSAGILVYEQSSNNTFYKNNVTHSGDGLFLWAGQTTMDTGKGGCNDNLIMANDFSYAPTNGIEVTFSRNMIIDNRIYGCDNGIWAGYSYQSIINNNKFRNNRVGIAIEHGQENKIAYNIFWGDTEAVKLWARKSQPLDWGYARLRNTESKHYIIAYNNFSNNKRIFNFSRTNHLSVFNNIYASYDTLFATDGYVTDLDTSVSEEWEGGGALVFDTTVSFSFDNLQDPFKNAGRFTGRNNILITEWGPYDFRYPIIWNINPSESDSVMRFDIKGPSGKWRIKKVAGIDSVSQTEGDVPASLTAKKIFSKTVDVSIELEYMGEEVTNPFGIKTAKGKPYTFVFKKFFQPIDWQVSWYSIDTNKNNPVRTNQLFASDIISAPVKSWQTNRLDFSLWNGVQTDKGAFEQFITIAEGVAQMKPGEYEIAVTWDEAVKVYVDGRLLINDWTPESYTFDESPHRKVKINLGGNHSFRVEHVNLKGFSTLNLKINKAE